MFAACWQVAPRLLRIRSLHFPGHSKVVGKKPSKKGIPRLVVKFPGPVHPEHDEKTDVQGEGERPRQSLIEEQARHLLCS